MYFIFDSWFCYGGFGFSFGGFDCWCGFVCGIGFVCGFGFVCEVVFVFDEVVFDEDFFVVGFIDV